MTALVLTAVAAVLAAPPPAAAAGFPTITLLAPTAVDGGQTITVTGELHDADGPIAHAPVSVIADCWRGPDSTTVGPVSTNSHGEYTMSFDAARCRGYTLTAWHQGAGYARSEAKAAVEVHRAPTQIVMTAPENAPTGEPVPITATYTQTDGTPIPGATVLLYIDSLSTGESYVSASTGADGVATFSVTFANDETYWSRVETAGTTLLDYAQAGLASTEAAHRPTTLTFEGPATAALDDTLHLTGHLDGPPSPADLELTDPAGAKSAVTTQANGDFAVDVPASLGGSRSWVIRFAETAQFAKAQASLAVDVARMTTSIQLDPVTPVYSDEVATISGQVLGVDEPGMIELSGEHVATRQLSTDATGHFSLGIIGAVGTVDFQVTFEGNDRSMWSRTNGSATFLSRPTTLTVNRPPAAVLGSRFTVTGHLVGPPPGSIVSVRSPRGVVYRGTSKADGTFSVTVKADGPPGTATYVVGYATYGDTYAKAQVSVRVTQRWRPSMTVYAVRPSAVVGGVAIYPRWKDPLFVTSFRPLLSGVCHRYRVQRVVSGAWRTVALSACVPMSATTGRSHWRWHVAPRRRVTYRVIAEFAGNTQAYAAHSAPRYVRFR